MAESLMLINEFWELIEFFNDDEDVMVADEVHMDERVHVADEVNMLVDTGLNELSMMFTVDGRLSRYRYGKDVFSALLDWRRVTLGEAPRNSNSQPEVLEVYTGVITRLPSEKLRVLARIVGRRIIYCSPDVDTLGAEWVNRAIKMGQQSNQRV